MKIKSVQTRINYFKRKSVLLVLLFVPFLFVSQQGTYKLAVLKYNGGGDYYANPTSLPNLITYCNQTFGTNISKDVC